MFSHLYKKIIFITISFVVLGHYAIQVEALEKTMSHVACDSGIHSKECIKKLDLNVCESIKTDELQITSKYFLASDVFTFSLLGCKNDTKKFNFTRKEEKNFISYNQLARSHLS